MIVGILMATLGLCIGLINFLTQTRREADKRLTGWGKPVVTLSIAVFAFSAWKIWQDSERDKIAPFVLTDSDIEIRLTASMVGEEKSHDLESRTPSSIEIGLVVPNEGGWTCLLEAIPGFVSSGFGHGPPVLKRVYLTKATNGLGNTAFKYVWDLAGKKVQMRNPRYAFSDVVRGHLVKSWGTEVIVRIKRIEFHAEDPSAFKLEFVLSGLDRDTLERRLAQSASSAILYARDGSEPVHQIVEPVTGPRRLIGRTYQPSFDRIAVHVIELLRAFPFRVDVEGSEAPPPDSMANRCGRWLAVAAVKRPQRNGLQGRS